MPTEAGCACEHQPRYITVQNRWRDLAACAGGIVPTLLPLEPSAADFVEVAEDLRLLARKVDALIAAYGDYVDANMTGCDRSLFRDVLFGALDGNALHEIECATQRLYDDGY